MLSMLLHVFAIVWRRCVLCLSVEIKRDEVDA
jgi:hypothetical protein